MISPACADMHPRSVCFPQKEEPDLGRMLFSPAFNIFEGPRLGTFRLGKEHLIKDAAGESKISFADYAFAFAFAVATTFAMVDDA